MHGFSATLSACVHYTGERERERQRRRGKKLPKFWRRRIRCIQSLHFEECMNEAITIIQRKQNT